MSRNQRRSSLPIPTIPEHIRDTTRYYPSSSSDNDFEEAERSYKSGGAFAKGRKLTHPDGQFHLIPDTSSVATSTFYKNLPRQHKTTIQPFRVDARSPQNHQEMSLTQMGYDSTAVHNWSGLHQPPKIDLFVLLRQMIMSFEKTNVQIRIAETTFNCHMLVLQCYSEFFKELNDEQQIVLPAEKVTPEAFHKVYEWMLTSQPIVQREGILELFNAAQFLKIGGLVSQCWVCLDDDERFCEDAAFLLYLEARVLGQDQLIQQLMLNRVSKFFLTLVASKEFLEFDVDELCRLLSSNSIGVNSETDVLMSAARWLDSLWPERMCHIVEVMRCVRFGLMAPWQLVELKQIVNVQEIQRFVESKSVKIMIDNALSYVTTKYWYTDNAADSVQMERLQFVEPLERQWILDPVWINNFQANKQICFSFSAFTEYLAMIRLMGADHWRSIKFSDRNPNEVHQEQRMVVSPWANIRGAEERRDEISVDMMDSDAMSNITL